MLAMNHMLRWMVAVAVLALTMGANAQSASDGAWSVVVGDDVLVRSGPSAESFYHFFKLKKGDLIRVVSEKNGWAQVRPVGPAFAEAYGYVKADQRVQVNGDGKSGRVTAKTDLLAPNLVTKGNPDSSWKQLARLNPDETVTILGSVQGSRDSMLKVTLPASAEAYVNMAFLRPASADEVSSHEARIGKAATDKPAPPPVEPKTNVKAPEGAKETPKADGPKADAPKIETPKPPAAESKPLDPTPTTKPAIVEESKPVDQAAADEPKDVVEEKPVEPTKKLEEVTLSDLEWAFETSAKEPVRTAEFGPLRERYLEFASRPKTSEYEKKYALLRAERLSVREEAQKTLFEIEELKRKNNREKEDVDAVLTKIQARADYVAVGRLNASSIYDGKRLPLLYRVQDDGTGQTVAYMRPGSSFDLTGMLGQLIGIVGEKSYDGALRLNLIAPNRIDVLGPRDATKEPPLN
jgi:hypothetical protein